MEKELTYNTVIVGAGVSGLYAALKLPKEQNILLICKEDLPSCDSMLAQGGICVQRDETDYDSFFEDTLKAGHYENRKESVDIMIRNSRAVINDLLALGVRFDKEADGSLKYTREGAHAKPRICFHKDITGKEITETLLRNVQALPNVTIMDYTVMEDLLVEGNTCHGIVAKAENGRYPADSCGKHNSGNRRHRGSDMTFYKLPFPDGGCTPSGRKIRRGAGKYGLCADSPHQPLQRKARQSIF